MAIRRGLMAGAAVLLAAVALWAKPGIVKTRDGTAYQGEVDESEEGKVTVTVHGIAMKIDRHDVYSIQYIDTPQAEYQKRISALAPNDVKGRLDLAKWAFSQQMYDQARQAAESARTLDPHNTQISDFLLTLQKQVELERAHPMTPPDNNAMNPPSGGTTAAEQPKIATLSVDDINIIRQAELVPRENFRVAFPNDVRKKYADQQGIKLADFLATAPQDQALAIIANAPKLRGDVRIQSDPASLATFKQKVQPAILQGCATSGCHGGYSAGSLVLISPVDNDPAMYTNFYILCQYAKKADQATYSMIDRATPQNSLVLQYGLAPEVAQIRHPDVPNYHGLFRTANDPRYQSILNWVTHTLTPVAPDYGIKYEIPHGHSTTTAPSKR